MAGRWQHTGIRAAQRTGGNPFGSAPAGERVITQREVSRGTPDSENSPVLSLEPVKQKRPPARPNHIIRLTGAGQLKQAPVSIIRCAGQHMQAPVSINLPHWSALARPNTAARPNTVSIPPPCRCPVKQHQSLFLASFAAPCTCASAKALVPDRNGHATNSRAVASFGQTLPSPAGSLSQLFLGEGQTLPSPAGSLCPHLGKNAAVFGRGSNPSIPRQIYLALCHKIKPLLLDHFWPRKIKEIEKTLGFCHFRCGGRRIRTTT